MKKILSLTISLVLILGLCVPMVSADGNVFFEIDFEDKNGTAWSLADAGWSNASAEGTTVATVDAATEGVGSGKVLKLQKDSTQDINVTIPLGYMPNNDALVVEYDVYFGGSTSDSAGIHLLDGGQYYYSEWYNRGNDGDMDFSNIASSEFGIDAANLATWYRVKAVYETVNSTTTLTLTATDKNNGAVKLNWTNPYVGGQPSSSLIIGNANCYYGKGAWSGAITLYLDNVKVYKLTKFGYTGSETIGSGLSIETESVSFEMNDTIADGVSSLKLYKDGEEVTSGYSFSTSGSTVTANFTSNLIYGATYSIDYSGLKDGNGQSVSIGTGSVSFTTEAAPNVYIKDVKIYKGYGGSASVVTAPGKDSALYTTAVTLSNTTGSAQNAVVLYGVYSADGKLLGCVYAGKSIAAGSDELIGTGLTLGSDAAYIRVFLWDTVASMKPYQKNLSETVQ